MQKCVVSVCTCASSPMGCHTCACVCIEGLTLARALAVLGMEPLGKGDDDSHQCEQDHEQEHIDSYQASYNTRIWRNENYMTLGIIIMESCVHILHIMCTSYTNLYIIIYIHMSSISWVFYLGSKNLRNGI